MNSSYLAQTINLNGQKIVGPLKGITRLADLVNRIVGFVIPLAVVILFLMLVWGGYDFMLSRGNPERIKTAKAKITTSIVGFILLIMSYLIVRVLARILGFGEGLF